MGLTKPFAFMGAGAAAGTLVDTGLNFYVDAGRTDSYPGSGLTWTDLQGTSTQTLESGISYTSGDNGYLESSTTSEYSSGASGVHVLPTTANAEFTVELLVYPTDVNARYAAIFNYWGNAADTNQSYWYGTNPSGGIHVGGRDGAYTLNYDSSTNPLSNNNWYHIVFCCTLGTDMDIYVNNTFLETESLTSLIQYDRTGAGTGGYLGLWKQTQTTVSNTMLGRIATARAYSGYRFTSDDVTNNYNYWKDTRGYSI